MRKLLLLLTWLIALPTGMLAAGTTWQSATLIEKGSPTNGSLSKDHTEDWYKIQVPENGEVTITSTPYGELDLYYTELYALDSENTLRSRNSKWVGTAQGAFTVYDCAKGTYYVVVRRYGGAGEYTVQYDFKATSADYPDDHEPNNSWEQAKPLPMAQNVTGHLGYVYYNDMDTEDWFKIEVPENGEVTITSTPHGELDLYHTELYALDSENTLRSRDSKWVGKEQGAFTVYNCAKGTYYVVVRRYGAQGGYTVRYDFKATSADYPDDHEPNNSWEQAKLLPMAQDVTGHFGYVYYNDMDTEDWFKIEVPENGEVTITSTPHGELDLYYTELYALDSENALRSRNSKWVGKEQGAFTVYNCAKGTYYVVARRYGGQGGYTIRYDFKATSAEYANDAEPNNRWETAQLLKRGHTLTGHLGYFYYDDIDTGDWFKIVVPRDGTIKLNFAPHGDLNLYYTEIHALDSEHVLHSRASKWSGTELGEIVVPDAAPGTYYVVVKRYGGQGAYSLQYTFIQNDYATDRESNNTREEAVPLEKGVTVAGHLGYFYYNDRDTEDWYRLSVTAKGTVEINIKPTDELDLYYVTLYDSNEHSKASKWVGKEEEKITAENLEPGTYYLNVSRYGGYGTYFLCYNAAIGTVDKQEPLPDEPNDDNPNMVEKGGTTYEVDDNGDVTIIDVTPDDEKGIVIICGYPGPNWHIRIKPEVFVNIPWKDIVIEYTTPPTPTTPIPENDVKDVTLHVPPGCKEVYEKDSEWSKFKEIVDDNDNSQSSTACLIVWLSEAEKHYYNLSEKPKITMASGSFIVSTTTTTFTYPFDKVAKFTLDDSGTTAIKNMAVAPQPSVERQGKRIVMTGCTPNSAIRIYSANGRLVATQWADGNGRAEVSITGLTAGVYIVKSDSVTLKIAKR